MSVRQRLAILTVAALTIAGCSSSDDSSKDGSGQAETHTANLTLKPKPKNGSLAAMISCAKSAGYNVDRRERNLIVIGGEPGQGQMNVERMPSHAEAVAAAKAADLIESRVVGRIWLKYSAPEGDSLRNDVDSCALTGSPD